MPARRHFADSVKPKTPTDILHKAERGSATEKTIIRICKYAAPKKAKSDARRPQNKLTAKSR
jgi:hypothetical protein